VVEQAEASSSLDGQWLFPTWPLFVYGGQPAEIRALYESFPILFLLGFQNAALAARFAFSRITSRTAATTRAGDSGDDAGIGRRPVAWTYAGSVKRTPVTRG